MKSFFSLLLLSLITLVTIQAQQIELSGQIIANGQLEGIHVINKTAYRYATTDQNGFFIIEGKLSDSLYFSSIQYIPKTIVLSTQNISTKSITVTLSESINALDEVLIGTLLTGDLNSDIGNSDAKRPIDFYDLGIPGYTGPRMNLTERRLFEANNGPLIPLRIPPSINFYKLLNMITGRSKVLKKHAKLDYDKQTIRRIKEVIAPLFFINHELEKEKRMEFYYFCADAPDFQERCRGKSDVEILEFLDVQLEAFNSANLSQN
ncbi:MAG: hypothetical protein P8P55_08830 [Flavobacteriaceae bacterium]|nr:hypothetical protein [Flavobacteriaceae bacterium]